MGVLQVSEELQRVIDRQVAEGRASNADVFLDQAIRLYADWLEAEDEEALAAADEGIADIEAGRYERIETADDLLSLRKALDAKLYHRA